MRKQPYWAPATPPPAEGQPHIRRSDGTQLITQTREYQLITPLFGGGVEPAQADPITVVRAAEIRGQLRFWWRATRGGRCNGNLKLLKQEEDAIWGSAASTGKDKSQGGPSQVWVEVIIRDKGQPDKPFEVIQRKIQPRKGSIVPAYAAFPLQPPEAEVKKSGANTDIKSVCVGVAFTLKVTYPAPLLKDIEAALWAWETFGGLGARTRRGFGALRLVRVDGQPYNDLPPSDLEQAKKWLRERLQRHVVEGTWPDNVPHLGSQLQVVMRTASDPLKVWQDLFDKLKIFRQSRFSNSKGKAGFGRSKWCEPSAIREITDQSLPAHSRPIPNPAIIKFPRAAFGLPIGFQFKDADKHSPNNKSADPRKTSLELKDHDRLASPLILKPLACQDNKAIGLALILQGAGLFCQKGKTTMPREQPVLKAKEGQRIDKPMDVLLTAAEAAQIPPLHGNPDVLQAFLKFLDGGK